MGISFNPDIPTTLGFFTILAILLVSYMGTQAQALTKKRLYTAVLGRADRLVVLIFGGISTIIIPTAMLYAVWIIFILSGVTFFQRFFQTALALRKE